MSRYYCQICGAPLSKRNLFEVETLYDENERICHNCGALYYVDGGEANYCGDPADLENKEGA